VIAYEIFRVRRDFFDRYEFQGILRVSNRRGRGTPEHTPKESCTKDRSVHACYYPSSMGFAQVGIALHHL
jgi:hypothetical protein